VILYLTGAIVLYLGIACVVVSVCKASARADAAIERMAAKDWRRVA